MSGSPSTCPSARVWTGLLSGLGGARASRVACLTVFAHELGHHLLRVRGQQSGDLAADELAAWDRAHEIARKHGLLGPLHGPAPRAAHLP